MAAAAASAASDDEDARTCFICLEPGGGRRSQRLLHGGCGCRGGSGFGHVACIAKAAQETNEDMWYDCPTCKQMWTGQMELGLTRARVASLASLPDGDWDRLNATNMLTQALKSMCEHTEALSLGVATLAVARRVHGDEDAVTLTAMGVLADVHRWMGNPTLALPLLTEALAVWRRVFGDDDQNTMATAGNVATTHMRMKNYDAALPLMAEGLERTRRLQDDDSENALIAMGNLAELHDRMGRHDLALPLHRDTLQRSRRVLGNRHPSTLHAVSRTGHSLCCGGDSAGIALLEEAVAGHTAVLGADHPHTRASQQVLNWAKRRESREIQKSEESDGEEEDDDDDDDETIADRIRKRRRHA